MIKVALALHFFIHVLSIFPDFELMYNVWETHKFLKTTSVVSSIQLFLNSWHKK
jgi:hypothetical protein